MYTLHRSVIKLQLPQGVSARYPHGHHACNRPALRHQLQPIERASPRQFANQRAPSRLLAPAPFATLSPDSQAGDVRSSSLHSADSAASEFDWAAQWYPVAFTSDVPVGAFSPPEIRRPLQLARPNNMGTRLQLSREIVFDMPTSSLSAIRVDLTCCLKDHRPLGNLCH